jgi:hypothetical protein
VTSGCVGLVEGATKVTSLDELKDQMDHKIRVPKYAWWSELVPILYQVTHPPVNHKCPPILKTPQNMP